jgi:hypothetical protein
MSSGKLDRNVLFPRKVVKKKATHKEVPEWKEDLWP